MQNFINQFQHFFEYDLWANQKVLDSLRSNSETTGRMLEIFSHILGAQKLWYQRITGGDYGPNMVWPTLTIGECEAALQQTNELWLDYLQGLTLDVLSKPIPYTNSKGQSFENAIHDILMQVIMHGTYHRAQIAILLRQAGAQPPATDYIVYVRRK